MVTRTANRPSSASPPAMAVILAFYNKLDYLLLVLASLEMQTFKDFEVIIADDGSRPDVVDALKNYMDKSALRMVHLWHPDDGFRKNQILNHAVVQSAADYVVFVDGDCVLHPEFMADHWSKRKSRTIVAGRRVCLTPFVTRRLTPARVLDGFLQKQYWWIFFAILLEKHNNAAKGIRFTHPMLRRWADNKPRGVLGCNFSLHKADLLAVNGFDTRYVGPGMGEDSDISFRLMLDGCAVRPCTHMAVQYHLYHKLLKRPMDNERLFDTVVAAGRAVTSFGIREMGLT